MAADVNQAPRFTHRNPTIELLVLAAPLILMMLSRLAMQLIDFWMVSWLGTEAQAAIGPATIFAFMLSCIGMGVASAVQTYVAQADGRGTPAEGGAYTWQSLYVAVLMGVVAIPIGVYTPEWFGVIARFGEHSEAVTQLEIDYLSVALHIVAPATICAGLQGFFNGIQKPRIGLYAVIISTLVNAQANCVLMFGMWGFPEMGIAGAAWGTVIGWSVRALLLCAAMFLPEFAQYDAVHGLGFCWKKIKGLIYVGAPASIQWLVEIGSWAVFNVIVMPRFGEVAMAGANIAVQIMHVTFMPAIGLGMALTSQVGFAIGEKNIDKAMQRVRIAAWVMGSYMVGMGVLILLMRPQLIMIFNTDLSVIAAGSTILIWVAIFQLGDALAITHMTALRGAGDTRVPAAVMATVAWLFQGIGAWLVAYYAPGLGVSGPWLMCTLYILTLGAYLTWRWYRGPWQEIKLFKDDGAETPQPTETELDAPVWPKEATPLAVGEASDAAMTREK